MNASGHRFTEHTADIAFEIWAPSEQALLSEAARAAIEVITEGASVEPNATCSVEIESVDQEDRLVQWLNEILWLATGKAFLFTDADIELHEDGLVAQVHGKADAESLVVTEVKSATYHDLHLAREASGRYVARVVLDV